MPYIHWETHTAQKEVARWIEEAKLDSEKTSGDQENTFWPSKKPAPGPKPTLKIAKQPQTITSDAEKVTIKTQDVKDPYRELLRRYLFKRRPIHLRRTLDQYYYSYLADTNFRDSDQVVMRQLNEDKKELKLKSNSNYQELKRIRDSEQSIADSSLFSRILQEIRRNLPTTLEEVKSWSILDEVKSRPTLEEVKSQLDKIEQTNYWDKNNPILMVDQLWLWKLDESLSHIT
jgi:hypothetical protein